MRSSLIYCFFLLAVAGCRPSVDSEELGDLIYELPNVPGAEEPYKLPNLDVEKEKEPKAEAARENRPETPHPTGPPAAIPPEGNQPQTGSSTPPEN